MTAEAPPAPFKCMGGKTRLYPALRAVFPESFAGYYEPFLGGGAVLRHLLAEGRLRGARVCGIDLCEGAAEVWAALLDPKSLKKMEMSLALYAARYNAATHASTREVIYYTEREIWNKGSRSPARHIFLRNTGFNGLWRENQAGLHNVPWGKKTAFQPPAVEQLARALTDAGTRPSFRKAPALEAFDAAEPHDFVYLDPPYLGDFSGYTRQGFDLNDHVELLQACQSATERGVQVVYSNRWSEEVCDLVATHWPSATQKRLDTVQTMAARSVARTAVREMVAHR